MRYDKIILHEPHASIEGLYNNQLSFWKIDEAFINEAVVELTDWHTDFLFHGLCDRRIKSVRFPYSRFIVDAERLWNDPLEKIGQGILYREYKGFCREIPAWARGRLFGLWHNHQQRLKRALESSCNGTIGSAALLLDCHSFPAKMSDVDICIGFNEDCSKPDIQTIEFAVNYFEESGYKVGINTPYSNSIAPECGISYRSMMLEINKKTYLKGDTILLASNSGRYGKNLSDVIAHFMQILLE